ncbi:MAG: hypothetical protein HQ478_04530 [Chloroflexi bacterium]|nr:hypothetical protein [Chloroflexota bacterium]
MTLRANRLLPLATVTMLVFAIACGTEEDQNTDQQGVGAAPTPTQSGVIEPTPVSFPFPVVELIVGDERYPSAQGSYCWPDAVDGASVISICADMALDWELDERIPVPRGTTPVIDIEFS